MFEEERHHNYIRKDNIMIKDDIVFYFYELGALNFNANNDGLEGATTLTKKMISRLGMNGGIYLMPTEINQKDIREFAMNNFESNYLKDDKYIQELFEEMLNEFTFTNKFNSHIFLYFVDNRQSISNRANIIDKFMNTSSSNSIKFLKKKDIDDSLLLRLAIESEKKIYESIIKDFKAIKVDSNVLNEIFNYVEFPHLHKNSIEFSDKYVKEYEEHIEIKGYDESDNLHEVYCKNLSISKFPKNANLDIYHLIKNIPVMIHLRFDILQSRLMKKMIKNELSKAKSKEKKYRFIFGKSERKNAKEIRQIELDLNEVQENGIDINIDFKVNICISSDSIETLEKVSKTIITNYLEDFKVDRLVGNQLVTYKENMYDDYLAKNTWVMSLDSFSKLGLFLGDTIGDTIGYPNYKNQDGKIIFTNNQAIFSGKYKSMNPTTLTIGEMGSGKTYKAINECFKMMIYNGTKSLFIYPKDDELKIIYDSEYSKYIRVIHINDSSNSSKGMLDPFVLTNLDNIESKVEYDNELRLVITRVQTLVKQLLAFNGKKPINTNNINLSILSMIHSDDKNNMINFIKHYEKYEEDNAQELLSLSDTVTLNLFFSNDNSNLDYEMDKPFTFIHIHNMVSYKENEENDDNKKMILIISSIEQLIKQFVQGEKMCKVSIDELHVFTSFPKGNEIISNISVTCRSLGIEFETLTQFITHVSDELLEAFGQVFIGKVNSMKSLELIREKIGLSQKSYYHLKEHISTSDIQNSDNRFKSEQTKHYWFVYKDINKNQDIVELIPIKRLDKALDTKIL